MAHGGRAYVLMAGLVLMYSMCIFHFMDMICADMRVMGYTMYVFELMYLWVFGLRACMYDDGLEPYAV